MSLLHGPMTRGELREALDAEANRREAPPPNETLRPMDTAVGSPR
jgi:hypothetical protein